MIALRTSQYAVWCVRAQAARSRSVVRGRSRVTAWHVVYLGSIFRTEDFLWQARGDTIDARQLKDMDKTFQPRIRRSETGGHR